MQVNAGRFPKLTILMFVSDPRKRSQADGRRGFLNGGIAPFRATDQAAPANGSALSCHNAASRRPGPSHRGEVQMSSMKKEEARRAVLSEYDRWAKKHPNKASMAFSSSDTYRMKSPTFSIFVRLATRSGKSFTAGFGIGWKISLSSRWARILLCDAVRRRSSRCQPTNEDY